MKFRNKLPSVEEVKKTDMVDYLSSLGFKPSKICRKDYWYLSPLRQETTASFKVNRNINRWYDFGQGKGVNIIDFGLAYHNCNVKELLAKFNQPFSFRQQNILMDKVDDEVKRIKIINNREISSLVLVRYLHQRRIPVDIAQKFCREIDYELYGKNYFAIGFKNDAGGFELRNEKFKAGSSPKDITLIQNKASRLTFLKAFLTSFLTWPSIKNKTSQTPIF